MRIFFTIIFLSLLTVVYSQKVTDSLPRIQLRANLLNAVYGDIRLGTQIRIHPQCYAETYLTRFTSKTQGGWMWQLGLRKYIQYKKFQPFGISISLLALSRYQHFFYDTERSDYDSAGNLVNYITTYTFSGHYYTDIRKKVNTAGLEVGIVLPFSLDRKHRKWTLEWGGAWRYMPVPRKLLNLHGQGTDPYTGNSLFYNYFFNPELNGKWYTYRQGSAFKMQLNLCYNLR